MERFPRSYTYTAEHNTTSANNSAAAEGSKGRQRSRVTNGSALLPGVDGRSAWVRRCKDIIEAHLSDRRTCDASFWHRYGREVVAPYTTETRRGCLGHSGPTLAIFFFEGGAINSEGSIRL